MNTSPESQRAASDAVSVAALLDQVCTIYRAFKVPQVEAERQSADAVVHKRFCDAASLNMGITNAQKKFEHNWSKFSPDQRLLALDLLLEYYCRSRKGDNIKDEILWSNVSVAIGFGPRINPIRARRDADNIPLFLAAESAKRRLASIETFIDLLDILYSTPLDDREFSAFAQSRKAISVANRYLASARKLEDRHGGREAVKIAQRGLEDHIGQLAARLRRSDAVRQVHLERFEAAERLLHERATGQATGDNPHRAALVTGFERLGSAGQSAAVQCAREFVYAACVERAEHGRALDPLPFVGKLFNALGSSKLGSAWRCGLVSHDLDMIVNFYVAHYAPTSIVDGLADILADKKAAWATNLFPHLPVATQEQAVRHCGQLRLDAHAQWEHQSTLPDGARMQAEFLALLAPWVLRAPPPEQARW
ncbi:hypothetical protein JCM3775_007423 [Rhodotorula graminis]